MNTEVEDYDSTEILYELIIEAEWNKKPEWVRSLETEFPKQGWRLSPFKTYPVLGTSQIFKISSCLLPWQLVSSNDGKVVAILQETLLEIRSSKDDYGTIISKCSVNPDLYPWMRKVCWSSDCNLLAIGHTNGDIGVYDLSASLIFKIETNNDKQPPTKAGFAFLTFVERKQYSTNWLCELMGITYSGKLYSYSISSSHQYQDNQEYDFGRFYSRGVLCGALGPGGNILYIGGIHSQIKGSRNDARRFGVSAWRILSEHPYYDDVTVMGQDKYSSSLWKFSLYGIETKFVEDPIFYMSMCPLGQHIACIHESGQISIWSIPSLKLLRYWPLNIQDDFELGEGNAFLTYRKTNRGITSSSLFKDHPVTLKWWSSDFISIVRVSGVLTICSISMLANHLGDKPEWFGGFRAPVISDCFDRRMLVMECDANVGSKSSEDGTSIDERDLIRADADNSPSYLEMLTDTIKDSMYWVTDSETFRPTKRKPVVIQKTYRLILLKSASPEELFEIKIDAEEYGEALLLAQTYNLDTDKVYQKQWHNSPISVDSIQDYLWKIKKRSWVLYECIERVPDDLNVCYTLLQYGLRGTHLKEFLKIGKGQDDGLFNWLSPTEDLTANDMQLIQPGDLQQLSLDQRDLLKYRQRLLQYLDCLFIYEGLLESERDFDPKFYELFRKQSSLEAAVNFAQDCNFDALAALFTFKSEFTLPHRLLILCYIPETASPYEYSNLLPECDLSGEVMDWNKKSIRDYDWSESAHFSLQDDESEKQQFLYEKESWVLDLNYRSPGAKDLTEWYCKRACLIEERSCLVSNAADLIRLGKQRNVAMLSELFDDLETLETLVYEVQNDENLRLEELRQMRENHKIDLMMKLVDESNIVRATKQWLVPFLKRCEAHVPGSSWTLFENYMVSLAKDRLHLVALIFEESKQSASDRIIALPEKLMELALLCIYEMESTSQLMCAFKILECLPQRGFGPSGEQMSELHDKVDALELEMVSVDELLTWKVAISVSSLHNIREDKDSIVVLFVNLVETVPENMGVLTEETWLELFESMMKIRNDIFNVVKDVDIIEIIARHLLKTANMNDITLAVKFLEGDLIGRYKGVSIPSKQRKEFLILEAVRDYFDKSRNYEDEGIELAKYCLHFLDQSSPEVIDELDLISSLGILGQHNVNLLPIKVRRCENKVDLIQKCLENKTSAYKRIQPLLKLACFLRLHYDDKKLLESTVYYLCAQYAFQVKDYKKCCDFCQKLISNSYCDAWKMCNQLGDCDELQDSTLKENLLSFALSYCPSDKILDVLKSKKKVEFSILLQQVKLNSPDYNEDLKVIDSSSVSSASSVKSGGFIPGKLPIDLDAVMSATKDTTKVLLSFLSDQDMINKSLGWITDTLHSNESQEDSKPTNYCPRDYSIPSYPEFYCSLACGDHLSSNFFTRYQGYGSAQGYYPRLEILNGTLRSSVQDSSISGSVAHVDEVILNLAKETMMEDEFLSLCYLISLSDHSLALDLLKSTPKTEFTLLFCIYFCALVLSPGILESISNPADALDHKPSEVISLAYEHIVNETSEDDRSEIASFFLASIKQLQDVHQAKVLISLGQGIEISRFAEDSEYRHDTIVGLAMSDDESLMDIVLQLAKRYDVTSWELHSAHTIHLLRDSDLSIDVIRQRLNDPLLIERLKENSQQLHEKLQAEVFPLLVGSDFDKLHNYYSVISECCPESKLTEVHINNLEKLQFLGIDIDYKMLLNNLETARVNLHDVLDEDNVADLAEIINSLHHSADSVYGLWALIKFNEDVRYEPEKCLSHFESRVDILDNLCPQEYKLFLEKGVMSSAAVDNIHRKYRLDILRKAFKHAQNNANAGKENWPEVEICLDHWIQFMQKLDDMESLDWSKHESKTFSDTISAVEKSYGNETVINNVLIAALLDGVPTNIVMEIFQIFCESSSISEVLIETILGILKDIRNENWANKADQMRALLSHYTTLEEQSCLEPLLEELNSIVIDSHVDLNNRIAAVEAFQSVLEKKLTLPYITYLFTRAILHSYDLDITPTSFITADSRNDILTNFINTSHSFTTLCDVLHLLRYWPQDVVTTSLWETCIMKCFSVETPANYQLLVDSVVWYEKNQHLSAEVIEKIFSESKQKLVTKDWLKIGLNAHESAIHQYCIDKMLEFEEVNDSSCDKDVLSRILDLKLTPRLVKSHYYSHILDFVLELQSSQEVKNIARQLYDSGYEYEAGSLMLVSQSVPKSLLTFSASLFSVQKLLEM